MNDKGQTARPPTAEDLAWARKTVAGDGYLPWADVERAKRLLGLPAEGLTEAERAAYAQVVAKRRDAHSNHPDWFVLGQPVADVYQRSCDAEFILDDDFGDNESPVEWAALAWRECLVPVASLPDKYRFDTLEAHLSALRLDRWNTLDDELQRTEAIVDWVREVGGIQAALEQSPLLMTLRKGEVVIEDGYHRLGVAVHCFGETHVRALVAVVPECGPQSVLPPKGQSRGGPSGPRI